MARPKRSCSNRRTIEFASREEAIVEIQQTLGFEVAQPHGSRSSVARLISRDQIQVGDVDLVRMTMDVHKAGLWK